MYVISGDEVLVFEVETLFFFNKNLLINHQKCLLSNLWIYVFAFQFKTKGGNKCWDGMGQQVGGGPIGLSYCHHFGGNQVKWMKSLINTQWYGSTVGLTFSQTKDEIID